MSAHILDQCKETKEFEEILKQPGGPTKYYTNSNEMCYPRLRLAIEDNHKEFVAHMYSQEILYREW